MSDPPEGRAPLKRAGLIVLAIAGAGLLAKLLYDVVFQGTVGLGI